MSFQIAESFFFWDLATTTVRSQSAVFCQALATGFDLASVVAAGLARFFHTKLGPSVHEVAFSKSSADTPLRPCRNSAVRLASLVYLSSRVLPCSASGSMMVCCSFGGPCGKIGGRLGGLLICLTKVFLGTPRRMSLDGDCGLKPASPMAYVPTTPSASAFDTTKKS